MTGKRYLTALLTALVLTVLSISGLWTASAAGPAAPPADVLQKADALYAKRVDLSNVQQTVKLLEPYLESGSYDALWRLARCNYWLGHRSKGKENRLPLFEKGKELAQKAIDANNSRPEGYYWLASNIGKAGLERGILNSLMSVKPMKAALDKVLVIDSSYSDAHRVLSELYAKVPGWPLSIGDSKKAVAHAEAALAARPDSIRYNRCAAEAYLEAKDSKAAKVCLETIIKAPLSAEEPDDDRDDKDWAAKEIKKL